MYKCASLRCRPFYSGRCLNFDLAILAKLGHTGRPFHHHGLNRVREKKSDNGSLV